MEAASPQIGNVERVQAKIAACEQEITQAETKLRQASLAAVLGDGTEGEEASRQLQALRDRRALLAMALGEAERLAAEKENAEQYRAFQAARRSLAQKCGAILRDAAEVARATETLNKAKARMVETGEGIIALLPSRLRTDQRPWDRLLSRVVLTDLCKLDAYRLGDRQEGKPATRLASFMQIEDPKTGAILPMVDRLAEWSANLKAAFEACGPQVGAVQPVSATTGTLAGGEAGLLVPSPASSPADVLKPASMQGASESEKDAASLQEDIGHAIAAAIMEGLIPGPAGQASENKEEEEDTPQLCAIAQEKEVTNE